jgi:ribosomal protein S18 acetylase RimI-like enzyme
MRISACFPKRISARYRWTNAKPCGFARAAERHPERLLVATRDGRVVGFAAFGPPHDDDAPANRAEIYAIYVAPTH